ncbi:hypothetical protein G7046_g4461 [Stylonectria norvegica]|nr:hypothetical protein G7046_g4461 [Stylonectria norvegica]
MRLSGLQKDVIALYRNCLRESRKKPQNTRIHFEAFARSEFAKSMAVDKRDFAAIEFLLRKGRRQLEVYSEPGIKDTLGHSAHATANLETEHQLRFSGSVRDPASLFYLDALHGLGTRAIDLQARATLVTDTPIPPMRARVAGRRSQGAPSEEPRYRGILDAAIFHPLAHSQTQTYQTTNGAHYTPTAKDIDRNSRTTTTDTRQPSTLNDAEQKDAPYVAMTDRACKKKHDDTQLDPVCACGSAGDAASDTKDITGPSWVDPKLVEAVARNVAQQLQLLSLTSQVASSVQRSEPKEQLVLDDNGNPSRTSSQREALDRFTTELQKYAEHTGAKGKLPIFTPTPTKSGNTLHTVSAILPFRPEFKAAGLAVTSKDQAQRSSHPTRASMTREIRKKPPKPKNRQPHLSQVDGNDASPSTNTEIAFITPESVNDWRFAMIDEVTPRKHKQAVTKKKSLSRCLPCFPDNDDQTTDGEPQRPPDTTKSQLKHSASAPIPKVPDIMGHSRPKTLTKNARSSDATAARFRTGAYPSTPRKTTHPKLLSLAQPSPRRYQSLPVQQLAQTLQDITEGGIPVPDVSAKSVEAAAITQFPGKKKADIPLEAPNEHEPGSPTSKLVKASREDRTPHLPRSIGHSHITICSRGAPGRCATRPSIPKRMSSIGGSLRSVDFGFDVTKTTDRDVLRGLHIAASAASDEQIDAFIREKTGLEIRRFLADLVLFENLRDDRQEGDKEQLVRKRRCEMRHLKQRVRKSREMEKVATSSA